MSGERTGAGDCVGFNIDLIGLPSFDGNGPLSSAVTLTVELPNVGGLIYLVHGEKLTRFEPRVEGMPVEPLLEAGESRGVWKYCVVSSDRSELWVETMRSDVLGGVGGRVERALSTSTIVRCVLNDEGLGAGTGTRPSQDHSDSERGSDDSQLRALGFRRHKALSRRFSQLVTVMHS